MNPVGPRGARKLGLPEVVTRFSSGTGLSTTRRPHSEVQVLAARRADRLAPAADRASARQELAVRRSQVRGVSESAPKSAGGRGDLLAASQGVLPGRAGRATDIVGYARRPRLRGPSTTDYAFGPVPPSARRQKPRLNAFTVAPESSPA